jgi:hypothetical protein
MVEHSARPGGALPVVSGHGCVAMCRHAATAENSDRRLPMQVNRVALVAMLHQSAGHTGLHLQSRVVNTLRGGLRASVQESGERADATLRHSSLLGMFVSYPIPNRLSLTPAG